MLAGDVISATVPRAKVNPVIAPQVLRLTSAVACCHVGFFTEGMESTSLPGSPDLGNVPPRLNRRPYPAVPGRVLRMACTCGSPALLAFWNSTLAFCAATGV